MNDASTLVELLELRASVRGGQRLYTFLADDGTEEGALSYEELDRRARRIAAVLQEGKARGERVVLLYPPGLDYVAGFFGCLYAGAVAVPAYPPDPSRLERTLPRLRAIIRDARASVVLTTSFVRGLGEMLFEQAPDLAELRWVATDELPEGGEQAWRRPEMTGESLAFLQYTSGSTGTPKGVMLSHSNLLHNLGLIRGAFGARTDSVGVIWLPPYHDMGLIGGILEPLYVGLHTALLSPLSFLRQPRLWLEAITRYGGTISGGPNFAFDLCVRRIPPAAREGLDLSSWKVAFCGAEPIRPRTLERFEEAFGPHGFRRQAFYACYGLAEATLIVSGGLEDEPPVLRAVDAAALERNEVRPLEPGSPGAQPFVGCGRALEELQVAIVEPESGRRCPPGTVGEIWVSGSSVAHGYWQRPEETERAFHARISGEEGPTFLRTGDLGFLQQGELFVTGRLKDLIILRGRNLYPQDLEQTVEQSHPALRPGSGAAFSVDVGGEERLVVVQEVDARRQPAPTEEVVGAIRQRLAELHEVQPHAVVLVEPGSTPKTSSGKIQRRACRAAFLEGDLREVGAWREGDRSETPASEATPHEVVQTPTTPEEVEAWLVARLAARVGERPETVDPEVPATRYGLDSLAAVELTHEVEQVLGVALPMELLLQGESLRALARRIVEARGGQSSGTRAPQVRRLAESQGPLSFEQQRLWFLDQLEPGSTAYVIPAVLRLRGALDVGALERSLEEVVRRHEALRTTFPVVEGRPVQVVGPVPPSRLEVESLEGLPEAERDAEALRRAREQVRQPFQLAEGPLLRARLLRLSEREHLLVLAMHHIVSDGWSMGVLMREVAALYGALREGQPTALPALPVQYTDYARWQREWLRGEVLETQLDYWRRQLAGAPQTLALPTDLPRPAVRSSRGAHHPVHLPWSLAEAIEALARREGVTPFMVLLAAFQTVLYRYSGQEDISVGSPVAGRGRPELAGLVGLFINTLVLRTRLSGQISFRELLGRVREVMGGAYAHQDVPFELLVQALQPARSQSHSPLFQVMLILQRSPQEGPELAGLESRLEDVHTGASMFDLTLSLGSGARGLEGAFEYSTDLFHASTVERLATHLRTLLEAAVAEPEQRLSALPLLPEEERRRVLVAWNETRREYAADCIHEQFAAQVARTPDAVAVVCGEESLSYRELARRVDALARRLRALGVGPDTVVGLCVRRSPEMVVGLLGILQAGGAYLPLDPGYPAERLAFMLQDSGARLLLTQRALAGTLPAEGVRVVSLDEADAGGAVPTATGGSGPDNLAYVLYTSGSTGRPKGVLVQHRNVANFFAGMDERLDTRPGGTWLAVTSISFDISVLELLWTLSRGFKVVVHGEEVADGSVTAALRRHGATHLQCTPSLARALLLEPGAAEGLGGLRQFLVGGEALPSELAEKLRRFVPGRLINMYGPTETTVWSSTHRVDEAPGAVPIGTPIANTGLYVLDGHLRPVPTGVAGELYIGGAGVVRGYLGRPELTAERFVPHPFGEPGARLYRTGDVARWRADGTVEFLGRADNQVKLRGFRIELGEIESVLARHPGVRAAVVSTWTPAPGDVRLVAYLVPGSGQALDTGALRELVRQGLPEYMVPSAFVVLEALPLTPNGKVDRKALPAPEGAGLEPRSFVAPRTPTEQLLAGLWARVLGVERVGLHDDFFELGGHSLLATQLFSAIRQAFQVELPLRDLFAAPTVAGLAERVDAAVRAGALQEQVPLRASRHEGPVALSFGQQRLWFLDRMEPGNPAYNVPGAVRLEGRLDVAALEGALRELSRRHEVLRATFHERAEEAVQVTSAPPEGWRLEVVDLGTLPEAGREAEARRLATEEARKSFDLGRGPLMRARLLRLGEREHVLLLVLHHIVSDGWSLGVLVREVGRLYGALTEGREPVLPALPVQYADYAVWQREWLRGPVLESQLEYWRQRLAGAPPVLELPTDRPRPPEQSFRGASLPVRLSRELSERVRALAQAEGSTPFMVLLAALQVVLYRYSGQEDLCVGSPVSGRNRTELEGLVGLFINTLVLRTRVAPGLRLRELLARVREATLEAYAHQDVPFERLVDELKLPRRLGHSPLFQVMLAFQQQELLPEQTLPGLRAHLLPVDAGTSRFDLSLSLTDSAEGFQGSLEYSTDLFERDTVERLSGHLMQVLATFVAHPERRVEEVEVLTEQERQRVLVEWNQTEVEYPSDTVVAEFERQVEARRGAVAVEFGEERLTYGELEERANRLAQYLRKRGVGAEARVALCVERGVELVVALVGIVKAGGCYVPLEASYPRERLEQMVGEAQAGVVVTESKHLGVLPVEGRRVVVLDLEREEIGRESTQRVESGVGPRNLAYIDFTSGSTGKPKGVCTEHRGVLRTVKGVDYAHLGPEETFLLIAPVTFDASTLEVWGSLLNGGRLVVYPPQPPGDVKELEGVLKKHGVTTLHLTAGLFAQMVEGNLEGLRGVRQLLTGGDVVSAPHVRRVLGELKVPVTACYGPTEGTLFTSCWRMEEQGQEGAVVPIGRPIGNTQVYVLDEHMRPVAVGVRGELYVGGDGLARGYLANPEQTAEKFVPNPFSTKEGERLYRTGDMVRWRGDGVLEFLGRRDTQVKVRGFRIELGEVEGALLEHPWVKEAVVVARGEGAQDKRLVGYVVGGAEGWPGVEGLREHMKKRVPEYMVPSAFMRLEAMPLTSNGKVDRKALPALEAVRPELEREYVAPRNDTEQRLADVWAQVLGLDRVGVHDNFFALGGDSILSLQLVAKARQRGLQVTPRQLFQRQTVAELAEVVGQGAGVEAWQGVVEGPVRPTAIQKWFLEQEWEEPAHFNQALLLEVKQRLDVGRLEEALQRVVEHHDALRMRFVREEGGWRQENAGLGAKVKVRRVDLSGIADEAQANALRTVGGEVQRSLELGSGVLLRAALIERGQGRSARLLLVAHHLVVDGVSWRVLVEDLERAYAQLEKGQKVELPAKTTSFKEWSEKLWAYARGEGLGKEKAYWEERSRGFGKLPVDREGGGNRVASERSVAVKLGAEKTKALLQEVPGAYRARPEEVLLGALGQVLARWTKQGRVAVEVEGHGREEVVSGVDVSRTVGWFTTVYPVVMEVKPGARGAEAVRAAKEAVRRVPGKGLGYGLLRHVREGEGRLAGVETAQVSFNYLGQLDSAVAESSRFGLALEDVGPSRSPRGQRGHLLDVTVVVVGGELRVTWTYSEEVHERGTVERLAKEWLEALEEVVEGRGSAEAGRYTGVDFPLAGVSGEELERVLKGREGVEEVYPLSALQQGLLFHAQMEPGSGLYVEQMSWEVNGALEVDAFRRAWEGVLARTAVLRTSFVWDELKEPLQVVQERVALPFEERDWRGLSAREQEEKLQEYLREDRARGFELGKAPLMRVALMRVGEKAYRCVWTHHHLLLDGWSLGLVLGDLFSTYEALVGGQAPHGQKRPEYREYIAWLGRQGLGEAEAYWREQLKGFRAPTPLPLEKRSGAQGQGEWVLELTKEETSALQGYAQKQQVTVNTLVQGAWALVLSRHAGEEDVVFGATVAGRPPELEGVGEMVGLFINTLPVRVKVEGGARVESWLKEMQRRQAEQRQYEHSPLVRVQGWSEVARGTPLFESLLVFENYPVDAALRAQAKRLDARDVRLEERTNYALTASVVPGDALRLKLAYSGERFEEAGARELVGQWKAALQGLVANTERRVEEVEVLTEQERQRVLVEWNQTEVEYPSDTVVAEFERQVEARRGAVAVEFGEERLTYGELEERANRLAQYLRKRGVGAEARVALCVERGVELVVALVGIVKAGGCYVPLEASYPRERLEQMVGEAQAGVVVTESKHLGVLPVEGRRVVVLDLEREEIGRESTQRVESGVGPRNLAYIDFTSGSTGKPKGVCTEHRGVLRTVKGVDYAHLGPEETFLLIAPVTFDASTLEVWGSLLNGGRLVVYPPQPPGDVKELEGVLKKHGVTTLHLTAGLFAQMVEGNLEGLRGVRQLLTGGDVVSAPHVRRVLGELKVPVTACYGPTESTLFTSCWRMEEEGQEGAVVPIGRPIGNTQVYVLDEHMRPVAVGVRGELYVGGDGLARGYLANPEQTAEKFVPNPFSTKEGERLYRTGDVVRWRGDGVLEFLGRQDTQVKVRGFRIELAEVEGALLEHPWVKEAVVVARGEGAQGKRLVGYVVGKEEGWPGVEGLREHMKKRVPEYMVPSAYMKLEAMPLTSNGKVDRKALPALEAVLPEREYVAPRNEVERLVAGAWEQVLGVERVGARDNFFELGGHSLLATQAVSRLRNTLRANVALKDLFDAPTVEELAVRLRSAAQVDLSLLPPTLRRAERNRPLPLSFAQQRLWFLDQLMPGTSLYIIPAALRFEGQLDVAALEASFQALAARHEVLRTTFQGRDGQVFQVIAPEPLQRLEVVDLTTLPESERESAALRRAAEEAQRPFDLARGPLLRTLLLKLDETVHVLVLTVHHSISDAWSTSILVREIAELYDATVRHQPSWLPALSLQYADFAVWQREWLQGEALEAQLAWWRQQLEGAPPALELPTDRLRPPAQTYRGANQRLLLPKALSDALHALCRAEGVTPFMVLLATYQTLLHRYSGQGDICVGTPIAGRNHPETEPLLGCFVNTLVLRARMAGNPRFRELLHQVRDTTLGAYAHQDVPFEKLVDALAPDRDLGRSPLFQAMLVLQNAPGPDLHLPGLDLSVVDLEPRTAQFDLTLTFVETADGFSANFNYNTDLFDAATVSRMAEHLCVLLEGVVSSPGTRLSELPLLTDAERHQLLGEWSGPRTAYPGDTCLHTWFEQQVERAPDARAVTFQGEHLTYRELNQRANRLAHHLRRLGVGPDEVVALCLERSLEMVVGILGILKAGGAYLPLDPAYPSERLAFMLEDSGARVVVTQRSASGHLPEHRASVVLLEGAGSLADECDDNPVPLASPGNLAYVIYTSGSTGRPKGVLIEHANVARLFTATEPWYHFDARDVWTLFHSYAFDFSVWELWGALLYGGRLVVVPFLTSRSPADFLRLLEQERVTVLNQTPSAFYTLVAAAEEADAGSNSLRLVIFGGEALDPQRLRPWVARYGARPVLVNMYGITETTVHVSYRPLVESLEGLTASVIGGPIPDLRLYLLDEGMRPVPVGVPGEIYVGGAGLARGYLGRPELTATRFVPDPFEGGGQRLYRSGDLARFRPNGDIEYLGRIDAQVKIRGFRIELGEIEAALARHPRVGEVTVLVRQDGPGEKRLVAYLVGRDGAAPDAAELRTLLRAHLPEYMVPAAFVTLESMPLTTNGKLDRKALPAPESIQPQGRVWLAPRTPNEVLLAEVWARVLRVERVGVDDNFFELGGDSILSIQVVAQATQAGLSITPTQLFQNQTLAALARVAVPLAQVREEEAPAPGLVPLTPIQRWFFARELPDPHHFNQSVLLSTREPLDASLLEQVLQSLVEHHDSLRLRFARSEQGWRQELAEPVPVRLRGVDLSSLPEARQSEALAAAAAELQAGFDLSWGPLLGAALFDLGAGRPGRLLLVLHHLVVDGVSWRVLLEDLELAYLRRLRGEPVSLPRRTTAFASWARRLETYALSEQAQGERARWLAELREPVRSLPRDTPGGLNSRDSVHNVVVSLEPEQTRLLLGEVPAAYHARIDEVLLAALARGLERWMGAGELRVELEGHGREPPFEGVDLSRTVGWFTTLYPVRLPLRDAEPAELVRSVREALRRVPGGGFGYGLLRYQPPAEVLESSAEVAFNYLGQFDAMAEASSLFRPASEPMGPTQGNTGPRSHVLEVTGLVLGGRLEISWAYSETLHSRGTIEALAQGFLLALRELISRREEPGAARYLPSDFPLARVDEATLAQVVRQVPRLEDLYPLSPLQQGLLFHALLSPDSGVYVQHLAWSFHAPVRLDAFRRAWETVVERHPILRTAFLWENLPEPLQAVQDRVELPWREHDWRDTPPAELPARLKAFLHEDGTRGLELSRAPLLRLAVLRLPGEVLRFVWTFHHLLLDGWSMGLVLRELFESYEALAQGREPALRRTPPYRDYMAWLARQELSSAESFWREALAGFSAPTPLPGARPGRPEESGEVVERELHLPTEATTALNAFARQHQLTLNTLVQGAWALVLGRYAGTEDVVFGTTVAGRPPELPDVESMVGLFLNTLPVRVRLPAGERVLPWLRRIQARQLELGQREHLPLVRLQSWSELPPGTPLFESFLVFENYPVDASLKDRAGALDVRDLYGSDRTNYPLAATAVPHARLLLKLAYDTSRFAPDTIGRLLEHWRQVLEELVARPEQRLNELSLLSSAERHQLLVEWNDTRTELPPEPLAHRLFEALAARTPEAIAISYEGAHLTYRELDRRSNQLAHHLRGLGVGPEVRVGLCVDRSLELVVGMLGVLKAGGAWVPLDPAYPQERLAFMLGEAGAPVLLTQRPLLDRLPPYSGHRLCLDADAAELARHPEHPPEPGVGPDNAAYVIFTSGSTGKPKGVLLTHRGLCNTALAAASTHGVKPESRVLQFAALGFDASVCEVFSTLLAGARLCLAPRESLLPGPSLRELLVDQHITHVTLTPSVLAQLEPEGLTELGTVISAGEACTPELARRWSVGRRLLNAYGPTEVTVCATLNAALDVERPTLGLPFPNVELYVLDEHLGLVPPGIPGELYVGGVGLARGYVGRPDLTAERFIPNPFSQEPGRRLYRTGDRVRFLPGRELEFLGRVDDQVKLRGIRVEPGEVAAVLAGHPSVREAAVVAREDTPGLHRLVAYVVAAEGQTPEPGALRSFLRGLLPEHMVPAAFVALPALPLTPNGKLDRRALPAPGSERPQLARTYEPPRTDSERRLAQIWSEVLGVQQVGLHDDFFELGGHSLLATRALARIRAEFRVDFPLRRLFESPTIATLSTFLVQQQADEAAPDELEAMLAELEQLSQDEAESLLVTDDTDSQED
ncbi:non-ribosomal peptide synthase/polyketide synthase [Archangium violaceum]|nr:non-ribosomal peptide synthase/polyketide synthase [Archangium violaceum]QRN95172.1 non-ribosomal peptide synthase/polyketide synthase [Archangium violaceum]